ncbi:hypothetical protein QBC32DRAFT_326958 [Pseudoneurospora amorphoporcata]|uniref:Uncharacterized protein n=1 Tax=Pseudoneurospora amorphoporcata TaxID=241081 RepID=A0AAN6SDC8_9PEZI|nr:hypothetical protein QBC32DRAFT_326958 [Pseudoneurospora amorphoporcata]
MSELGSPSENLPSAFEANGAPGVSSHGGGSPFRQRPTNDSARASLHLQYSSTFGPTPNILFINSHSQAAYNHQHPQMNFQQYFSQPEQIISTVFSPPTTPSLPTTTGISSMSDMESVPPLYTGSVPHLHFSFPMVSQCEWFSSQHVPPVQPGVYQNDTSHMPNTNGRASDWTEQHTEILREGKRLGKTVQQIIEHLSALDGKMRTPNCVTKRWARLKENCVPKQERDSIIHNLTPAMLQLVYNEVAKLGRGRMLNNNAGELAAVGQDLEEIAKRHMERCVQDMVVRMFGNNTTPPE